jgi:hypothetical protein
MRAPPGGPSAESSPTQTIHSSPNPVVVQLIQSRRPHGSNLMDQCSAAAEQVQRSSTTDWLR